MEQLIVSLTEEQMRKLRQIHLIEHPDVLFEDVVGELVDEAFRRFQSEWENPGQVF